MHREGSLLAILAYGQNLVQNLRGRDRLIAAHAAASIAFSAINLVLDVPGYVAGMEASADEFADTGFCCWHTHSRCESQEWRGQPLNHYKLASLMRWNR